MDWLCTTADLLRRLLQGSDIRNMKRFLLWAFDRGSIQYDVICGLILAFIFLTPGHAFNDRPDYMRVSASDPQVKKTIANGSEVFTVKLDSAVLWDNEEHRKAAVETLEKVLESSREYRKEAADIYDNRHDHRVRDLDRATGGKLKTITSLVCDQSLAHFAPDSIRADTDNRSGLEEYGAGECEVPDSPGRYQRRSTTPLFNDLDDPSIGKIWILRTGNAPRRIKIDFDKPQKEYFLIEKNSFLHYYPVTKQGDTKSLSEEGQAEGECVFLGLCQSTAVIQQHYDPKVVGQETIGSVKTTVLELKSKDVKRSRGISVDPAVAGFLKVDTGSDANHPGKRQLHRSEIFEYQHCEVFRLRIRNQASQGRQYQYAEVTYCSRSMALPSCHV